MADLGADDSELVRRLCQGDAAAAKALYQSHGSGLLRFALALCGVRQTAEDIVHDTFVELLRYPGRYNPERGSLSAYLYSIARHRSARVARSERRHSPFGTEPGSDVPAENVDTENAESHALPLLQALTTEDNSERAHTIEQVRAAVLDLPLIHREIIALCDLEELPYSEVALILNCPIGTVRSRLHRARLQLAQRLETMGFLDEKRLDDKRLEDKAGGGETPPASTMLACRGTVP